MQEIPRAGEIITPARSDEDSQQAATPTGCGGGRPWVIMPAARTASLSSEPGDSRAIGHVHGLYTMNEQ